MASADSSRRQVPFGGHQLAEYALAAALIGVGLHLSGRPAAVLVVGGGLVGLLALLTKGPLAAVRFLPKRVHLYLDLVLAVGFAFSPALSPHNLQVVPIILCEAVAVLLVRMSITTQIVPPPPAERGATPSTAARLGAMLSSRPARRQSEPQVPPSNTPQVPPAIAAKHSGGSEVAGAVAATAGRVVGVAVAKARDSSAPSAAARGLGRATGHARRIGRAAREAASAPNGSKPAPAPSGPNQPGGEGP